ncbi:hypothetical protein OV079_51395 [Nannocystis pusilla]|uniref:Uncharacterized protein n=1 Tax=Nannocystis pusilla TaxID=889268 RepID=A0A9X3J561_9BACT|nr:hypothetical protein [Nannocystis pusilla]MCY1013798.1 hypothetical protein [Nannocystis pusilla]
MLTIGKDQLARFREPPRRASKPRWSNTWPPSPPLFKTLGEEPMLVVVRTGMAAAERHGFNLRGPVRMYLELMLLFGSRFDTDPQYQVPRAADGRARRAADAAGRADPRAGDGVPPAGGRAGRRLHLAALRRILHSRSSRWSTRRRRSSGRWRASSRRCTWRKSPTSASRR